MIEYHCDNCNGFDQKEEYLVEVRVSFGANLMVSKYFCRPCADAVLAGMSSKAIHREGWKP